ncbi:MAG: DUF5668 domain-containing protein [Candidatus Aminicenantales bacterium]|jgi:TM2 domain-containing membrane protein YozV
MTDKIYIQNRPPKSPAAAGILSGFFPGAGQLYNGEAPKALIFFLIFAGCISMMPRGPMPFLPLVFAGFYVYQIIEAIQTANAINRKVLNEMAAGTGAGVTAPSAPPAPAKAPTPGSAFWGSLLIGLGVVFLLANFDVIAIDRIWDFWPVLVIVIGLKMIFDYSRKKD